MVPPVHEYYPATESGHDDAHSITELFRQGGPGTTVLLQPRHVYTLHTSIDLSHPGTTLATKGYPDFSSGQQAIIETRGEKEATAVNMFNKPNTALKRVHLRGCRGWGRHRPETDQERDKLRREGKLGWIEGGGSLVWMGGPDSFDSVVEGCRIEDPRGWTGLHLCDFATRNRVVDNIVGPCGQEAGAGPWADGLSIAGKDSLITGNTVIDATDGAIVIFCAPGTLVANNTIIARTRDVLGAINLVDDFPFDRDFTGTRVIGNKISSEEGAYVRLAIGCGPTCWSPWNEHHKINYGAHILHNFIGPGVMGYGIALSGTQDFVIEGNVILPDTTFSGDLTRCQFNAAPTAFLREWPDRQRVNNCTVQDGFVYGEANWLIGGDPGLGSRLMYEGGQLALDQDGANRVREAGQVAIKGVRWYVSSEGQLELRQVHDQDKYGRRGPGRGRDGAVLWKSGHAGSSNTGSNNSESARPQDPVLDFPEYGALAVRSHGGKGDALWDPITYLIPHLHHSDSLPPLKPRVPDPRNWSGHPQLTLSAHKPYLELRTKDGDLAYASSYEYSSKDNWSLYDGHWIAIAPKSLRGTDFSSSSNPSETCDAASSPPIIPPRPQGQGYGQDQQQQQQQHRFSNFMQGAAANFDPNHPSSFLRNVFSGNQPQHQHHQQQKQHVGAPPVVPPRPGSASHAPAQTKPLRPTFLFLNPITAQITLHSSHSPSHPDPAHVHFVAPTDPVPGPIDRCWLALQGDSNLVLYVQRPPSGGAGQDAGEIFVPWASHTGEGDGRGPLTLVLKGSDDDDGDGSNGPAMELRGETGKVWWSSKGGKVQ